MKKSGEVRQQGFFDRLKFWQTNDPTTRAGATPEVNQANLCIDLGLVHGGGGVLELCLVEGGKYLWCVENISFFIHVSRSRTLIGTRYGMRLG